MHVALLRLDHLKPADDHQLPVLHESLIRGLLLQDPLQHDVLFVTLLV